MSINPYKLLRELLPVAPLQVGIVSGVDNNVATVSLPGGGTVKARGLASIGSRVFVRDGVIEGPAPTLTIEVIDV